MAAERADAARNRLAILRATEELLVQRGLEHVSLDAVAARAGVGKGTVFRRFGNRTGLFRELLAERAARIRDAIDNGPPPLGPGAPAGDRLIGFLDELATLAAKNITLIAAHEQACAADKHQDPTYQRWHAHLVGLVHEIRPDADAEFLAHTLLGSFDGELVRRITDRGGVERLRTAVRDLARTIAPAMSAHATDPPAGSHAHTPGR
ncbi:TetR/AcrR family transcriptional regulator [Actinoplanes teichomyceticus]|uniref:TetR family transcriptional regulator n=1 Tax=Actinoplanes teichomyceticus TaxID=1867 RepID=A0A561VIK1_ACTTI|nr:TetR/AcrR family transcriptional regulator [Actinoplanes teichomyceticus]TWG11442.1 TetR family transcriptional regulator [Actinoplanes teichomyceticus]GIF15744.1 TetR family transcriptional regulator [Actinoplanes teichomyceticus]